MPSGSPKQQRSTAQTIALGASAGAVALGVTLGVGAMASAATETPAPSSSTTASPDSTDGQRTFDGPGRDGRGGPGHAGAGLDAAALATKLGVDEAAMTDALEAARDATKPDTGVEPPEADAGAGERPDPGAMEDALVASLADSLELDESAVRTAFDELRAELQDERQAQVQERLDGAVADGSLTQTEADGAAKALELGLLGAGGGRP